MGEESDHESHYFNNRCNCSFFCCCLFSYFIYKGCKKTETPFWKEKKVIFILFDMNQGCRLTAHNLHHFIYLRMSNISTPPPNFMKGFSIVLYVITEITVVIASDINGREIYHTMLKTENA